MAIPFAFPSDDEIDSNYQRLDQLLVDLFDVLQQILVTQRRIRDAQPSHISQRGEYFVQTKKKIIIFITLFFFLIKFSIK